MITFFASAGRHLIPSVVRKVGHHVENPERRIKTEAICTPCRVRVAYRYPCTSCMEGCVDGKRRMKMKKSNRWIHYDPKDVCPRQ